MNIGYKYQDMFYREIKLTVLQAQQYWFKQALGTNFNYIKKIITYYIYI